MDIRLRHFCLDDQKELAKQANHYDIAKNLRNVFPYPYTCIDALNFISFVLKRPRQYGEDFVIEVNGQLAGVIGVTFFDDIYEDNCEVGFWLGKDYWQQGIMTKALHILIEDIFNHTSIQKITAEVFADNIASQKVFLHNGFTSEALLKKHIKKDGHYKDVILFRLLKDEYSHI